MSLRESVKTEMIAMMKAKNKPRLGVIRLISAEIKQREVDERVELSDEEVVISLDKMLKQRRDSIAAFEKAGRTELAEQEAYEITVIKEFLPEALTEDEISQMVAAAISETGAESMKDMGKVMGILRPQMQGRADMSVVSPMVKQQLS
ncbi:MAG: GatB/YqeY domain-containing protein [Methylococcales bacterium]|jgi:uncharacterized protein|nr:GatB/YqeY domain-containing protein [Methylococcales bacterium]MBT7446058.1 GatB/YqeY domain-containing protein [Methylococcales bacterium]